MPASAAGLPAESPVAAAWARMRGWHDDLLASPRFRHWAAAFPLTRPIARRRARALFDLCGGFIYTQVLLACVRLRVIEAVRAGPRDPRGVAREIGLDPFAAERLLDAAISLRLLTRRRGGLIGLGPLGAALVENPAITAMVEHHALAYADFADPVALLRGERRATALACYWPYAGAIPPAAIADGQVAAYSSLMSASLPLVAAEVLAAYDIRRHRCLLDVGGGEGVFLTAAAARAPDLRLMLFDLPPVAARACERLAASSIAVSVAGGDFYADALPRGADIVSLIRVLLDHDDEGAAAILRAVRAALPPGGTVLIAEAMSGTAGAEPIADAYFGFYLMAMGRGRPRSPARLTTLLSETGFDRVRLLPTHTPLIARVMTARAA